MTRDVNILHLKGIDKLREKLPAYPGKKIAILPLIAMTVGVLTFAVLIILDIIPRVFSDIAFLVAIEPFVPLLSSCFVAALALWLIWSVWNKRERMKEKHGPLAYQKILLRGLTGVFIIPSLVFHSFTSIRSLPPSPPANDLTIQWSRSLLPILGIVPEVELWLRMILSGILLLLGLLTVRSAILTFGVDYMAVVYLYFPEESEIQNHEIYSIIRHPTYLGGILLGTAALFFRFSVYSILIGLMVILVFRLQIWKEEKELVERFGEGYIEYRKKVPALLVRPSKIKSYFKFLRANLQSES
ncbi:MAG: methyltransferase family protein [Candidatus Sifarchaeia archaeon]